MFKTSNCGYREILGEDLVWGDCFVDVYWGSEKGWTDLGEKEIRKIEEVGKKGGWFILEVSEVGS